MSPILERVREFLIRHNLPANVRSNGTVLVVPMGLKHCQSNIVFQHEDGDDDLVVKALHPTNIPTDRCSLVAEFLTRLNWNLSGHHFVLDWSDGEVQLRRDVALIGALDDNMISFWFQTACIILDGYHPSLMNVVYRGMPPLQAVEQGEADLAAVVNSWKNHGREQV